MSATSRLAVEVTKGDDFLNIWVDANNNGIRDDDDVNIFVSKCGNLFAESPTFKQSLDAHLKQRLKDASVALMEAGHDAVKEEEICDLALELVIKACSLPAAVEAIAAAAPQPAPAASNEQIYAQWASQPPASAEEPAQYTEHGIPIYRPLT